MIIRVDMSTLRDAAEVHSAAWIDSHRAFCTEEFLLEHTPDKQYIYLKEKLENGAAIFMYVDSAPAGVVSVTESLIEDLYVLPERRNAGIGSKLLEFAMDMCPDIPMLWVLENNEGAQRLYRRHGFGPTDIRFPITAKLDEILYMPEELM